MQIAILDFGTNTFNLLIADTANNKHLNIIHSSKEPVNLGKGGIHKRIITEDAFKRGMTAIENHLETVKGYNVEKIYAFGTSAIRDAHNGRAFIKTVRERFNMYVHIIPGEREAELIYRGVRLSTDMGNDPALILDIGGGSNEFIIANNKKIFWKFSFNLGMARMLEKFSPNDPINQEDIEHIESYFNQELQPLFDAIQIYEPSYLIGASGSFETFSSILSHLYPAKYSLKDSSIHEISESDYLMLHKMLLKSTLEERKKMPGMEPVRVEMIVLASIFVNFTLKQCKLHKIFQSDYALKEGIIAEILNI